MDCDDQPLFNANSIAHIVSLKVAVEINGDEFLNVKQEKRKNLFEDDTIPERIFSKDLQGMRARKRLVLNESKQKN